MSASCLDWSPLLAAGIDPGQLSLYDPVSPSAGAISELYLLVLAICAGIFIIVEGMILYCIFRFRRGSKEQEPPQVYGSRPIEAAWTVAPLLTVFVVFLVVIRTVMAVHDGEPPKGALHI